MTVGATRVAIDGDSWMINGKPTYEGRTYRDWKIEGLLLNSRMANALFDDTNEVTRSLWRYPDSGDWDPDRNTSEFVAMLPEYREQGLLAVTVNLQGAAPFGYYRLPEFREYLRSLGVDRPDGEIWSGLPSPESQPWHNSAFDADGALTQPHLDRLTTVLGCADELGMVVILGLFYFGQDERLRDEAAVCRAVDETCGWLLDGGHTNVVIEINNECNVQRYEHEILQPDRVHELIERAKAITKDGRRLLAGTSYGGRRVPDDSVCAVSDFLLMHGNGVTDPNRMAEMVDQARALPSYTPMPVLFIEDDHFEFDKPLNNFAVALSRYASWGYFDPGEGAGGAAASGDYEEGYQNVPVNWSINTPRKRAFFDMVREVSGV
ncbi:MAG: hypothetical protein FI707_08575 [SAR202 cluster bacterium]|jgi:hypothetical protein|nr:hypothetical protein [Chloroflexota bacterium]MDP6665299.1 hypothetical protein [SAR202 cluster bacterium]MQG57602.1 hypothetical protein [SAR202 cluster bacterium]MQG68834.1 hypothetical protein [SAR202 cluster bacterium]HAL47822.1 hypothetical protein [Dehalococcoidia bacterium]|tara:strand:+ start:4925 stop:6058 length:1134 start_codon:yes stop_codon:yes gene_type:complete